MQPLSTQARIVELRAKLHSLGDRAADVRKISSELCRDAYVIKKYTTMYRNLRCP